MHGLGLPVAQETGPASTGGPIAADGCTSAVRAHEIGIKQAFEIIEAESALARWCMPRRRHWFQLPFLSSSE